MWRIGALDYRPANQNKSSDGFTLPSADSAAGHQHKRKPYGKISKKGRFKLEAVQPCQPFNYSFNISGYGAPLLSIAYPTKDEADEAHAKIAEALEKAVEVAQPGRVAKESAGGTQGPSLW